MRRDTMNTNILSDTILTIARLLLPHKEHEATAELLIKAAHRLYLCPDCKERPCTCEMPFI